MMEALDLKALQAVRYDSIERKALAKAESIAVDKTDSLLVRFEKFMKEIKNPYIMQCGKTIVEVKFSDSGRTIESQVKNYLKSLKTG